MALEKESGIGPYSAERAGKEGRECGGFVCEWRSGGVLAETEGGWALRVGRRVEKFEIMRIIIRIMILRKQ